MLRSASSVSFLSLILAASVAISGCALIRTAPERGSEEIQPMVPVQKAKAKKGDATGALFVAEFRGAESVIGREGCRLRVINRQTNKNAFIELRPGEASYTALAPGVYDTRRLGCGLSKLWDLTGLFSSGFTVEPGNVSYLGKAIFIFKDGNLAEIKRAARVDSGEALNLALEKVPSGAQDTIISGFTSRPITREMREGSLREGFDVFGRGAKEPEKTLKPLIDNLMACASEAGKTDPVRIGSVKIVAEYTGGKFVKFKEESGENAFSSELIACIKASHERFAPDVMTFLEVRTLY